MECYGLPYRSCATCDLNPGKNSFSGVIFSEAGAKENSLDYFGFGWLDKS